MVSLSRAFAVLVMLVLCTSSVAAQTPEDLQKISEVQAWLKSLEPRLIPKGVTAARRMQTELQTLTTQFKPIPPPPPPPPPEPIACIPGPWITVAATDWGACTLDATGALSQTRVLSQELTIAVPASNGGSTAACEPATRSVTETQSCTPPAPPPPPPPATWTFLPSQASISAGQSVVLSFTTTTADVHNVFINGQRPPPATCDASSCAGSMTVTPVQTTTYTLTSTNSNQAPYPSLSLTVTVTGTVPTPTPDPTPPPEPTPGVYLLDSQAEIDRYRYGRGAYAATVDYDATMNAAKWSWPAGALSAENLRLPIFLQRPATGSSKLLIISDHYWDSSWFAEFVNDLTRLDGWKWLQLTVNTGPDSIRDQIWFEPQMRWIGADPSVLSYFGVRGYLPVRAPTTNVNAEACGLRFGESLGPMGCFKAKPNTWTRIWIEVEERAGDQYARLSMWMADETQEPVQILKDAEMFSYGVHRQFWFEYNTSSTRRTGGPMAAWGRNVQVLKNVDPIPLLIKPGR